MCTSEQFMHVSDFKFTSSAITEERCCKYAMPLSNNPALCMFLWISIDEKKKLSFIPSNKRNAALLICCMTQT